MLANRPLHGAPSFRPCDRDRARLPDQGRDRVVAASDRRGGPRRTRTPVATAWEPPDRVALRLTRHVRSRDPTHDRRALRAPRMFALDGSEPRASAPAPNGEPEHAAWQHRRVDRRVRLPGLSGGRAVRPVRGSLPFRSAGDRPRRQEGPRSSQDACVLGRRGMGGAVGAAPAGGSAGAPTIVGIV